MADESITWHDTPQTSDENIDWHDRPRVIIQTGEAADHGLSERQKLSPLGKAVSPVTEYWPTYQRMLTEARQQMSGGAEQIGEGDIANVAKGAGRMGLGALGVLASPVNAAYRSVIGQPIEDVTGIPREYTEFAAQLATQGIGLPRAPGAGAVPGFSPTRAPPTPPPLPGTGADVVAAADRLSQTGAPVQVARAVASDSVPVQQMGQVVASAPVAGTPLVRAAGRSMEQLGTKADEVAQSYGAAGTAADTGQVASRSIRDWITGESQVNADKAYGKVDALVDKNITTPLDNTLDTVSQITAKRSAAGLDAGRAVDLVLPAVQRPGGLTYEGIKTLRTNIGEMLGRGILPDGVSGGELKQIYGALSGDLGTSVAASGPKAQAAFNRANTYYDLLTTRREALAKLVGAEGDAAPERVFDRLTALASTGPRADITKLAQARKAMGADDWNEVASSVVSRLGRDVEGNFSPQRFITDYNKISDAGKNLLFQSTDNPLKAHLEDINTVSSRFKQMQQFANPSGSARTVWGAAGLGGMFTEPLTTAATLLGTRVLANALAKPAQAASIAKWSQAKYAVARSPSPTTVAAYGLASRNLISTLGAKDITPQHFIAALGQPQGDSTMLPPITVTK